MKCNLDTEQKLYTMCLLVEDTAGALSQVSRLFSRKGYNIESIVSGATMEPGIIRISIEVCLRRETVMVKVQAADRDARDEILQIVNIFRAQVIDVCKTCLTIWVFGNRSKNAALIEMLQDFGILEIARTGTIAIERGRSTIYDDSKLKEEYDYGKNVL